MNFTASFRKGTSFARDNIFLVVGVFLILCVLVPCFIGMLFVPYGLTHVGAGKTSQPPSHDHPLGTDSSGRDLFALLIYGTPQTLRIGIIAGGLGLVVGTILAFLAGYFRGILDAIIRMFTDVLITVPIIAVLVIISSTIRVVSVSGMALIIALLSWMWPTRTIRAQVLVLREMNYVQMAKLSGMSGLEIIFRELMPNLMPYLAASCMNAIRAATLAELGISALGLGPTDIPRLGSTIYWAIFYGAFFRGMWWWWASPIVVIVVFFVGLFLVSMGLDQMANPLLKKSLQGKTVTAKI